MAVKYVVKRRNPKQWIEAVPSLPASTFVAYGGPDNFPPQRKALHSRIFKAILRGCRKSKHPQAILMMGGPASGKSTALEVIGREGYITLDSDAIKGELPEYRQAVEAGAKNAAAMAHAESGYLVWEAFLKAVKRRCDLIYDGTGKDADAYAEIIDILHRAGYSVRLVYVHVEKSIALPRALARADQSGRFVPEFIIDMAYSSIPYNFGYLAERCDAWTMFDTNEFPARLVADSPAYKMPVVYRPDLFDDYLRKYPQKTNLKVQNPARRRVIRNPAPFNAQAVERALNAWLRSGKDDGETGLG